MPEATAVAIGRAHIKAWSHHDWETTRHLLAENVHVVVTTTTPMKAVVELSGIEAYMGPKIRAASLVEPESVRELSAVGDETNALIVVSMRIRLGRSGTPVTLIRALIYLLDDDQKILEERDGYYVVP